MFARFWTSSLQEVPDWNCCGATAAHSINLRAGIELPLRNLRLARTLGNPDMLVPCPLCFNRLKTAVRGFDPRHGEGAPKIWDLAAFFATGDRLEKLASRVKKRLEGLKVVSYYGCMSSRPPEITGAPDYENPLSMDKIVKALGRRACRLALQNRLLRSEPYGLHAGGGL